MQNPLYIFAMHLNKMKARINQQENNKMPLIIGFKKT